MARIAILIPTYNEAENIAELIDRIESVLSDMDFEVIVVDDNSPDGTADIVEKLNIKYGNIVVLRRAGKYGLGSAYTDGLRWSRSNLSPDIFIQMDADFSHPPYYLPNLVKGILEGYDVIIGSRYVKDGGSISWSWHRKLISRVANLMVRLILRIREKDATSGFRALSKRAVNSLLNFTLSSKGYSYQIESLFLYSNLGLSVKEVPILFFERKKGKTKLSIPEMISFAYLLIHLKAIRFKK
ncbi:MAG: polyprenol monophosphomannose synthase [archaeon]|nr:polyprenol monophosphomannose synthase [archaeon]MCP8319834.1 polyprenol monophosphomannose synthase [archaeon]